MPPSRVKLTPQTLALLWAVLVTSCGAIVVQVKSNERQDMRLDYISRQVEEHHHMLLGHISLDGHSVALERTRGLADRLEKLERTKP